MSLERSLFRRIFLMLGLVAAASSAIAQDGAYPSRTIRIVVPFSGGSGSDASARYYAEKMQPLLKQSIIVDNKPGADGAIGMMAAKASPADGYTIVQGGISPSVVNAVVNKDLGYDPVKDFTPLLGYGRNMNVIVVSNESKLKSFADLLKQGKATPTPLNVATFSTTLHLAMAWLGDVADLKLTSIPYKGQGQALTDVMGSQVDLAIVDLGGASTLLKTGKIRALAVTGEKRSPDFPNVPTVKESGIPDYVLYSWNAFYVRSETPEPIRRKLAEAIHKVMTSPDAIENFYKPKGTEAIPLSTAQMQKMQQEEIDRFRKIAAKVEVAPR